MSSPVYLIGGGGGGIGRVGTVMVTEGNAGGGTTGTGAGAGVGVGTEATIFVTVPVGSLAIGAATVPPWPVSPPSLRRSSVGAERSSPRCARGWFGCANAA